MTGTDVAAVALGRPTWQRARLWLVLAGVIAVGALVVAISAISASSPGTPLDPNSPAHGGSKALAALLTQRGTTVTRLSAPADAVATPTTTTVVIVSPDDLGADQLRAISAEHRSVLLEPGVAALAAVTPDIERTDVASTDSIAADCAWPGAQAAGPVTFPAGTDSYTGTSTQLCYGGAVAVTDRLVVVGSAALLRNDQLANNNIAALDLNAISDDGAATQVAWLMPGVADTGIGSPSVWALFPPWAQRAFWWLLVVGVVVALWRGRRLGPVVVEPLPVIVPSAEVVEGHGRLYLRAGARERAAGLLRAATTARLAARLGLDRHAGAPEVASVLSATRGTGAAAALVGGDPADDAALVRLAGDLADLEAGSVPTVAAPNR